MSWWVRMLDGNGEILKVDRHSEGGTYAVGGTDEAEINVTYNYGIFFRAHLDSGDSLRWLHERKGKQCVRKLEKAVKELGRKKDTDYWKATKGNAGHVLSVLLGWARKYPDGVFEVV